LAGFITATHGWPPDLFLAVQNACVVEFVGDVRLSRSNLCFTTPSSSEGGTHKGGPSSIAANRMGVTDSQKDLGFNKWKAPGAAKRRKRTPGR
jgi:hypothetical protein